MYILLHVKYICYNVFLASIRYNYTYNNRHLYDIIILAVIIIAKVRPASYSLGQLIKRFSLAKSNTILFHVTFLFPHLSPFLYRLLSCTLSQQRGYPCEWSTDSGTTGSGNRSISQVHIILSKVLSKVDFGYYYTLSTLCEMLISKRTLF